MTPPLLRSRVNYIHYQVYLTMNKITVIVQDSFNISNMVDGSAFYYIANFIDSSSVVCNYSDISASSCDEKRVCTVSPVQLTDCSQDGNINVSVSAFNLLGKGQASNFSIGIHSYIFKSVLMTT